METIDLGDGLTVSVEEKSFVFRTRGYAHLFLEQDGNKEWQIHTDGKWFVDKRDIDQLIQCLQYVKEAVK